MSEPTTTVLHNSACSTSRHALEVADGVGADVEVVPSSSGRWIARLSWS